MIFLIFMIGASAEVMTIVHDPSQGSDLYLQVYLCILYFLYGHLINFLFVQYCNNLAYSAILIARATFLFVF
jgi:hypothetical protein